MHHFEITKIYSGSRASPRKKMKKLTRILFIIILIKGCAPSPSILAEVDPLLLVTNADSLLIARPDDSELRAAIITAHIHLAKANNSVGHYKEVLKIEPQNALANYNINMIEGRAHHMSGHKNGQWDAIQSFAKAAAAIDTIGEPHYWLGQAYEKKDEMDFELPLESYNKALLMFLPDDLRPEVAAAREALIKRKKVYEDFWK